MAARSRSAASAPSTWPRQNARRNCRPRHCRASTPGPRRCPGPGRRWRRLPVEHAEGVWGADLHHRGVGRGLVVDDHPDFRGWQRHAGAAIRVGGRRASASPTLKRFSSAPLCRATTRSQRRVGMLGQVQGEHLQGVAALRCERDASSTPMSCKRQGPRHVAEKPGPVGEPRPPAHGGPGQAPEAAGGHQAAVLFREGNGRPAGTGRPAEHGARPLDELLDEAGLPRRPRLPGRWPRRRQSDSAPEQLQGRLVADGLGHRRSPWPGRRGRAGWLSRAAGDGGGPAAASIHLSSVDKPSRSATPAVMASPAS